MAKQSIIIGSVPNDGTGSTLRDAGDLINDNFNEIYTAIGDGTTLTSGTFVTTTNSVTLLSKTISGASNTLSDIGNASLTNSTITITDGSTSTPTALGGTITFSGTANEVEVGESAGTITIGLPSNVTIGQDLTVTGDLTVNGTTTTVNSTTLTVDDKNIELGSTASPTDVSADGGGITLKGSTDKTFNWIDATDSWTSSEHLDLTTGKEFKINNTTVLSATQVLGKSIPTGDLVGTSDTQTLSNKTIDAGGGSGNIISNIANSSLANSNVTIGSTSIILGNTATTIAGLTSITSTTLTDGVVSISSGNISGVGTIDLTGAGSKARFNFAGFGSLPSASTYEGMFAYDTTGQRPYVADTGGWVRLLDENASISALSDVNTTGIADGYSLVWSSAQARFNVSAIPTAGFSIAMAVAL